jgi:phosphoribosylaminoimidazole-succinocarboxamide synthase
MPVLFESSLPGLPVRRGKVRDVYDLGDCLLIVATDRISAFDWVMPTPIPDKGRILTQLSLFWFQFLGIPHHVLSTDLGRVPFPPGTDWRSFEGRCMLVRRCRVVPIECVVRGYLEGSGWREYLAAGQVCGIPLPPGLKQCDRLPEPIFTPATKEATGHDQNISLAEMTQRVGAQTAGWLREHSLDAYRQAADYARQRGILIADTKFEWGWPGDSSDPDTLVLVDEVLTPDSSRFWPLDRYEPGHPQPSFDKQFLREWLETTGWDKNSPPPPLPDDIVVRTRQKYIEAYERLTGQTFV